MNVKQDLRKVDILFFNFFGLEVHITGKYITLSLLQMYVITRDIIYILTTMLMLFLKKYSLKFRIILYTKDLISTIRIYLMY